VNDKKDVNDDTRFEPKVLLHAARLIWKTHRGLTIALALLTLVQSLTPAAMAWIGKLIIDTVVQEITAGNKEWQRLGITLLIAFILGLFFQLTSHLAQVCYEIMGDILGQKTNILIMEKAATLDLSYFETPSYYDMLQRANQEASYRPLIMLQSVFSIIGSFVTIVSLVFLLFRFNPLAILILFLTTLPLAILQVYLGRERFKLQYDQVTDQRRLIYLGSLLTTKQYIKEIKLFRLTKLLLGRYKDLITKITFKRRSLHIKKYSLEMVLNALATSGYYGMYVWIAVEAINRQITLGDMTMYIMVMSQAQSVGAELLTTLAGIYEQNLFWGNLFKYLQLQPHIISNEYKSVRIHEPIQEGICLQGVSFKYPGTNKLVLHNINLTIRPGEKVALVGPNGAGKTSLVKLITRLYDPDEGTITLDGVDLRDYAIDHLYSKLSVIFQDFAQYNLSARENIGFGQIEALQDEKLIKEAARKSGADKFLNKLPKGYDTILGRWLGDSTIDLSLGEWQKIALSRMYMRDSPILILDEPTASLDAFAEYEIYNNLQYLASDRILILISHRYSTVRQVDRILVLDEGNIVENGSHSELITRNGLYASMYKLQAQRY
jgi:ATP-binding cassette subfamily B protein